MTRLPIASPFGQNVRAVFPYMRLKNIVPRSGEPAKPGQTMTRRRACLLLGHGLGERVGRRLTLEVCRY